MNTCRDSLALPLPSKGFRSSLDPFKTPYTFKCCQTSFTNCNTNIQTQPLCLILVITKLLLAFSPSFSLYNAFFWLCLVYFCLLFFFFCWFWTFFLFQSLLLHFLLASMLLCPAYLFFTVLSWPFNKLSLKLSTFLLHWHDLSGMLTVTASLGEKSG